LYSKIVPENSTLEFTLPSELSDSLAGTDEFDFDSTLVVFTETKALDLTTKFRKDADAYYVEAKRSTVSSVAQIPYWMYGILVVLGWNEAMAVLFNPVYFTLLLIALATSFVFFIILGSSITFLTWFYSYIIVQLGMVGPLFRVLHGLVREVRRCPSFTFFFLIY
jgi:protein SEY1